MWAFSDESERAATMFYTVVLVPPGAIDAARESMRGLLLPRERSLHTTKESPSRRKQILDVVARSQGVSAVTIRYRRRPRVERIDGRRLLLQAATGLVVASGVNFWLLDDQDPVQRDRDRTVITHALAGIDRVLRPTFDHRPSRDEPLLWAADAVCWAVGAGGQWRQQINAVLTVRTIGP